MSTRGAAALENPCIDAAIRRSRPRSRSRTAPQPSCRVQRTPARRSPHAGALARHRQRRQAASTDQQHCCRRRPYFPTKSRPRPFSSFLIPRVRKRCRPTKVKVRPRPRSWPRPRPRHPKSTLRPTTLRLRRVAKTAVLHLDICARTRAPSLRALCTQRPRVASQKLARKPPPTPGFLLCSRDHTFPLL